ncbi:MAG: hypothetical protein LBU74_02120 [Methanobacteriaceae archaeon]|jgi:hypothetical protein|nr:hypothetical protein [Candidatus Methanorudis spinitermitis]
MDKKLIGLVIVSILAVVTVSGCIGDNSDSTVYDGLVFNNGDISFNYPSDWKNFTSSSHNSAQVASLKTDKGDTSLLSVYIDSANYSIDEYKSLNEPNPGETLISSGDITIDGVKGFDISLKYYESGGGEQRIIGFIKNGYFYRIIFTTGDLKVINSDMDLVINSFKVL